jgi:uncharacterized damage-inducible protein DinB
MSSGYQDLPRTADERSTLLSFLEWQRATLVRKCQGLSTEQLRRRAVPPSNLSLLGLVRHLAEVERGWLRRTLAGEAIPPLYGADDTDDDRDFIDVDAADPEDAFATWRAECEHARRNVDAHALDDVVHQQTSRAVSLRWILVHMVEEYSRHNGHADLLRQAIDGAVGY